MKKVISLYLLLNINFLFSLLTPDDVLHYAEHGKNGYVFINNITNCKELEDLYNRYGHQEEGIFFSYKQDKNEPIWFYVQKMRHYDKKTEDTLFHKRPNAFLVLNQVWDEESHNWYDISKWTYCSQEKDIEQIQLESLKYPLEQTKTILTNPDGTKIHSYKNMLIKTNFSKLTFYVKTDIKSSVLEEQIPSDSPLKRRVDDSDSEEDDIQDHHKLLQ